jgi:hypothetical protein
VPTSGLVWRLASHRRCSQLGVSCRSRLLDFLIVLRIWTENSRMVCCTCCFQRFWHLPFFHPCHQGIESSCLVRPGAAITVSQSWSLEILIDVVHIRINGHDRIIIFASVANWDALMSLGFEKSALRFKHYSSLLLGDHITYKAVISNHLAACSVEIARIG